MAVDPGLHLSVEYERDDLLLERGHRGVEAGRHQPEVCRQVRREVLDERAAADQRVEVADVAGQVQVQKKVVAHRLQQLQALAVLAGVEAEDHLRFQ